MSRESNRSRLIRKYGTLLNERLIRLYAWMLHDDVVDDQLDDDILSRFLSSRYVSPRIQEVRKPKFNQFLHKQSDRGFLRSFRMERGSFHKLVELIQDHLRVHPGEKEESFGCCVFTGVSEVNRYPGFRRLCGAIGEVFKVGSGVAFNCIEQTTTALLALYRDYVSWPSPSEREAVAARICTDYDFPNCVGLVDGTLLPLAFESTACGEDYFTLKGGYASNATMFCDDNARITYMVIGWPGSIHDNRVWSNSRVY